ncbi:MFS transporter [Streptomyces sirii]|uniref:MFS transporter n=1 Tax=Streptomyces sirii TaxID=3127701 RepID=UPI003D3633FF
MRSLIPDLPRSAWTVLAADAFSAVGTGLTLPFLVVYLHSVQGFALGPVGLVAAMVALAGLAGNPLGGWLADRVGPRTALIAGLVIAAAGALGLSGVSALWQAFAAAAVSGLGVAVAWPAQDALLASLVRPAARPGAFAVRHATLNVGLGVGGLLAALMVDTARPGSFTTLYLLDAAGFLLAVPLLLRRSAARPAEADTEAHQALDAPVGACGADGGPGSPGDGSPGDGYATVLGDRCLRRLWLLVALLITVGYGQFNEVFPAYVARPGGPGVRIVAVMFLANTVTVVLAQLVTARLLTGHRRTRGLMLLCGLWAAGWAVVAFHGLVAGPLAACMVVGVAVIFAIGETLLTVAVPAITNDIAPQALRGRYNGGVTLAYTTGFLAGPAVGGFALTALGGSWFVAVAALTGAGVLVAQRLERGLTRAANGLPAEALPAPAAQAGSVPARGR